jgi:hypothetical protein
MTVNTPLQGVRAFAPVNYLGAPTIVHSPDAEAGAPTPPTPPSSLSMDEAISRFAAASTPPAVVPAKVDQAKAPEPSGDDTTEDEDPEEALAAETEDETEDEPGTEDQAEDDNTEEDEDAEPTPAKGKIVPLDGRVKLDDGTFVTVADLKKGSLLQADYTRKTQEVAEQRRSVETQSAAAKQRETQATQIAELATNLIRGVMPPEPDPRMALSSINGQPNPDYNPLKFQEDQINFGQWSKYLTDLAAYQQSTKTALQAETAEQVKARADKEWESALEKLPRLKDPAKLSAFSADAVKYGAKFGYSKEEIANIGMDHRQLVVLDAAIKWNKLQAKKATAPTPPATPRPPVKTSGKRVTADERQGRDASEALGRLNKTGKMADAVAAYLTLNSKGP